MKARLTSEVISRVRARIRNPKTRGIWGDMNERMGMLATSNRIYDVLARNEWNGKLTGEAILRYLESALGMTRDQLLETIDE